MNKPGRARGIFSNRTLNMRNIKAVGYDMDYTLIHYRMEVWERLAYGYLRNRLAEDNWPVEDLEFDPDLVIRGLIIDTDLGNLVKANRFGFVRRASHGTRPLEPEVLRDKYGDTLVDLAERRWVFLNTLFSISEACMYVQLIDRLDEGNLPAAMGYRDLYHRVRRALDLAHMEGQLKQEVASDPAKYVDVDPDMPLTLLDQKMAGKKVMLITNSEYGYAAPMLSFAFDNHLQGRESWRDVFDLTIVGARKPDFFAVSMPTFAVVGDEGLLREHRGDLEPGGVYVGSNAQLVERSLGVAGEEILYVGDHIFVDVNIAKSIRRWRTALILREIEDEVLAIEAFEADQSNLSGMMVYKETLEIRLSSLRLELQRMEHSYGPRSSRPKDGVQADLDQTHQTLVDLDRRVAVLAAASDGLFNSRWGLPMRAGKDKSHLARQVERYADIYTSRVSNFLFVTPYCYLRSPRGSLPHDLGPQPKE